MSLKNEEEKKLISIKIKDIPEEEHDELFNMYKDTYSNAGQPLWFNTKEELIKRYPCLMCYNGEYKKLYVLYQFKNKFNKISLVCHNGTDDEKKNSIKIRKELVSMPGWMLEASGATSWLLRKNNAPIIKEEANIKSALDISYENKNDRIEMNVNFDINDKNSYQYTRVYNDTKANKEYRTNETMFGTAPCEYTSQECDRKCNEIKKGGYKKRNTKKRNNKKKNTKKKNNKKRNTNRKL